MLGVQGLLTLALHRLLHRLEAALDLGIAGVDLETRLVRLRGAGEVALAVEGGALTAPALDPVGLDLRRLVGVGQGAVPVLLGGVGSGPVAVEDVVLGLDGDGLGELVAGGGQ